MYTYPDKDDLLTVSLIGSISQGEYWNDSENQVLQSAFSHLAKLESRRLLDVGCGQGRLLPVFAPHVHSIFALEPDKARFECAKQAASQITGTPVTVKNGDVTALTGDQEFDIVLLSHVLQHITDDSAGTLLHALSEHISPGGCVIAATTHTSGDADILTAEHFENGSRVCREVTRDEFEESFSKDGTLPVRLFAESSVKKLFSSHGFGKLAEKKYYHYYGKEQSAELDIQRNALCDGDGARDILYIFERG